MQRTIQLFPVSIEGDKILFCETTFAQESQNCQSHLNSNYFVGRNVVPLQPSEAKLMTR